MRKSLLVVLLCTLAFVAWPIRGAHGQFAKLTNPQMKVALTHPPQIALKGVQKLAVRDFGGECGTELSERLMQAVATTGKFEMIDRTHIEATLQEQGFQTTGAVSSESALKLGKLLGPSAMFTGRVTRCSLETSQPLVVAGDWKDSRGNPAIKYARRTTAQMTASVVLVDFTTGRTHTGKMIETRIERTNELLNLAPEPPDRNMVLTQMYRDAIAQVMRIIEPWDEVVAITVYDDDDSNKFRLKPPTEQMKRGDYRGAAEALRAMLAQGGGPKTTDKERAKANYNYGVSLMYVGRLDEALPALQRAQSLDQRNGIIKEGLEVAQRMADLERERERVEAAAVQFAAESGRQPKQDVVERASTSAPSAAAARITNADLIDMLKAKLPESVILARIKNAAPSFDTSGKALALLKQAGASENVLLAVVTAPAGK